MTKLAISGIGSQKCRSGWHKFQVYYLFETLLLHSTKAAVQVSPRIGFNFNCRIYGRQHEAFCDLVLKWRPIGWAEEHGQIHASIGPFLDKLTPRARNICRAQAIRHPRRQGRARPVDPRPHGSVGLYVRAAAPWFADFRTELRSFPTGRHDDQPDATGLIEQQLDQMMLPAKERPEVPRCQIGRTGGSGIGRG